MDRVPRNGRLDQLASTVEDLGSGKYVVTFDTNYLTVFTLDVKYGENVNLVFVILSILLAVFMLVGIGLHLRTQKN